MNVSEFFNNERISHNQHRYFKKIKHAEILISRFGVSIHDARIKAGIRKTDNYNVHLFDGYKSVKKTTVESVHYLNNVFPFAKPD